MSLIFGGQCTGIDCGGGGVGRGGGSGGVGASGDLEITSVRSDYHFLSI